MWSRTLAGARAGRHSGLGLGSQLGRDTVRSEDTVCHGLGRRSGLRTQPQPGDEDRSDGDRGQ